MQNEEQLDARLDPAAIFKRRARELDDILIALERRAIDPSWILRECVVEAMRQTYPRERSGRILPDGSEPISLSDGCTKEPVELKTSFANMPRNLPTSFSIVMGRQQANNNAFYNNTAKSYVRDANYVKLSERLAVEWDVRVDITEQLTITSLLERVKARKDELLYCMVSGIEFGKSKNDRPTYGQWLADVESAHVHIAIITNKQCKREDILKFFREHKSGGEYCVPRDQKQTYAGWRMHHRKAATKIEDIPHLWEYGTFPIDTLTDENGRKVLSMRRMYGRDSDDEMFSMLLDVGRRAQNAIVAQRKRKQQDEIEELRAEVKRLRDAM